MDWRHTNPDAPTTCDENPAIPRRSERQRIVEQVAFQLVRGYPRIQVVRALQDRYAISQRVAYLWVRRAQGLIAASPGDFNPDALRAQQAARLELIMSAEDRLVVETGEDGQSHSHVVKGSSYGEKIAAITEYNKLYGLHLPSKVALTDPEGKGVTLQQIVIEVEESRRTQVIDAEFVRADVARLIGGGNGEGVEDAVAAS